MQGEGGGVAALLAERTGAILMVGHLLQYHPCVQKLQSLRGRGRAGQAPLHHLQSPEPRQDPARRERPLEFAPHDISVILSLAGNQLPDQVRCTGDCLPHQRRRRHHPHQPTFPSGVRAHVYVSWLNPFKEQKLTVVGSNGMVVFDDTRPWEREAGAPPPVPDLDQRPDAHAEQERRAKRSSCRKPSRCVTNALHFLECCRDREPPAHRRPQKALRVLRVLQTAQRSLEHDGEAVRPDRASVRRMRRSPTPTTSSTRPPWWTTAPRSARAPRSGISATS